MRWKGQRQSNNIEDRRGNSSGGGGRGGGGLSITGIVIILIGYFLFDVDLSDEVGALDNKESTSISQNAAPPAQESQQEADLRGLTGMVLASTEDSWGAYFKRHDAHYREPKLVLYRNATSTACGRGTSATGPFYCPADEKIYIDLSFYDDMKDLGAEGDFAFAYVIAHEVGHHVQHLLGINEKVARQQERLSEKKANQLSVKQELQADCFAGVWGNYVGKQGLLEVGDVQEAMDTAAAIGDDRLQQQGQGHVVPDSFTHGTSAQRMQWFNRGFKSGDPDQCNTFG